MLCHLHEILTAKTLGNPKAAGRYRLPSEQINVVDDRTGEAS